MPWLLPNSLCHLSAWLFAWIAAFPEAREIFSFVQESLAFISSLSGCSWYAVGTAGWKKISTSQQIGFSAVFQKCCKLWFRNLMSFHLVNPHFAKLSLQPVFLVRFARCQTLLLISVVDVCWSDYLAGACEQACVCVWLLLAWQLVWYGISILVLCSGPPPLLGLFMQQKDKKTPKNPQTKSETHVGAGYGTMIHWPVWPEICRVQGSLEVVLIFLLELIPNRPSTSRGFVKSWQGLWAA